MRCVFLKIFDYFSVHKLSLYVLLVVSVILFALSASRITIEENLNSFFDDGDDSAGVLQTFKLMDRIVITIEGNNPEQMVKTANVISEKLKPLYDKNLISPIAEQNTLDVIDWSIDYIYDYLPIFLTQEDYVRIDSLLAEENIRSCVEDSYNTMLSPIGTFAERVIKKDPLNIGTPLLKKFEQFGSGYEYELYRGYFFTKDKKTLLLFVDPTLGMADTKNNDIIVKTLEEAKAEALGKVSKKNSKIDPDKASENEEEDICEIHFVGGPVVAVENARQMKMDSAITMTLALLILLPFLFLCFKSKRTIPLIIVPPLYGGLFALSIIASIKDTISGIAIGAGAVVFGIALSYSIHIIAHNNHTDNPRQIVNELANPLTLGCFTTIGAFVALLFTHSTLLQDMGLFAALTLVGTTLFSLIFLPHFLSHSTKKKSVLLEKIEQFNSFSFDRKKPLITVIFLVTIICLFFFNDVQFDDDMQHINYYPEELQKTEERAKTIMKDTCDFEYIVTLAENEDRAFEAYHRLNQSLNSLSKKNLISSFADASELIISETQQRDRINTWNEFWKYRKEKVVSEVRKEGMSKGFSAEAFAEFEELLNTDFTICKYNDEADFSVSSPLQDWISFENDNLSLISRISLKKEDKDVVYDEIKALGNSTVLDRGFFSSKIVAQTSDDFNYILFVSSAIVFLALLISYRRLDFTILTFLPLCISWVIILGVMALLDIRFNIVNIILATFIFGIGDDFAIFIMDGLLQEYYHGKQLLSAHKSAIFFSAFTAIIGMGVLIFAKHPALRSIAVMSVLGLCAVVLVAYTLLPFLFKLYTSFISNGKK